MQHEDISNKIRYLAADTLLSYAKSRYDELVAGNGDFVHYSSDQTVYKILEKEKIWLRNISFMNDYAEIETGRSILLRIFREKKLLNKYNEALRHIGIQSITMQDIIKEFENKNSENCLSSEESDDYLNIGSLGKNIIWGVFRCGRHMVVEQVRH